MTPEDTAEAVSFDDFNFDDTVESPEVPDDAPIKEIEPKEAQEVEQEAAAQPDLLEPPEFWSKEQKELFNQLQGFENSRSIAEGWVNQWHENQKYITQKSQTVAEEKRQFENQLNEYNQYQQALQGIMPVWQAQGIAPAVGVAQMAHYGRMLHTDPQALIQEVARFAGIDLNQLVEEQPYIAPELQERFRTLEQQNQQLQQAIGGYQQGQQQQSQQAIQNEITQFAELKSDGGDLAHPYFEQVRDVMANLLQVPNNGINDLKTAYDHAVQYHPEIQKEIREAQEKAAAKERQAKAEEAKKASVRTDSKSKDAPVRNPKTINGIFDDFSLGDD